MQTRVQGKVMSGCAVELVPVPAQLVAQHLGLEQVAKGFRDK